MCVVIRRMRCGGGGWSAFEETLGAGSGEVA
jgi:hypothetical protein